MAQFKTGQEWAALIDGYAKPGGYKPKSPELERNLDRQTALQKADLGDSMLGKVNQFQGRMFEMRDQMKGQAQDWALKQTGALGGAVQKAGKAVTAAM